MLRGIVVGKVMSITVVVSWVIIIGGSAICVCCERMCYGKCCPNSYNIAPGHQKWQFCNALPSRGKRWEIE